MHSSLLVKQQTSPSEQRNVKEVPFVELFDQRLQGVVSSGSDIQRVYVSFFEAGTLNFACSTNNNRPCGGLGSYPCNHLRELLDESVVQYGIERVVKFLRLPVDAAQIQTSRDILAHKGHPVREPAANIFSRFLSHLELLEIPSQSAPLHTLAWFG